MKNTRPITITKKRLHDEGDDDDLRCATPEQLIGMMWQLALDAWAFKENPDVEPRLQRDVIVVKRRGR